MPGQTHQVADPPPKAAAGLRRRLRLLQTLDRALARDHGGAVDYEPFQEVAPRFPEIARAEFEQAVKLIEPDGRVFSGAEAVYRSLGWGRRRGFWRWSYEHLPGFAPLSDAAYAFIARHRELAHTVTTVLWGKDVRRPTYFNARRWFLRMLGAIYLLAFLSLWMQVDGLIGAKGIAPLSRFLDRRSRAAWRQSYVVLPPSAG